MTGPSPSSSPSLFGRVSQEEVVLQLAEAILEYGRMLQQHCSTSEPVTVKLDDLIYRFREERPAIMQALLLLKDRGQAKPHIPGINWKVKVDG
ncbi:MAG: hypothetical protein JST79_19335 [Acidobacteria bacterium]|jgi:hypothetical protein|nr:hypothetical protein [Acidobacteriota bacterium]